LKDLGAIEEIFEPASATPPPTRTVYNYHQRLVFFICKPDTAFYPCHDTLIYIPPHIRD